MMEDGVQMIDASIDLAVIFKELCSIRVLSDILMDDVQRDLVTLSSLQVFRKHSNLKTKSKGRIKTIEPPNGKQNNEDQRLQQERRQQRESLEILASRCQKRTRNKNQLSSKIDTQILKSLQQLNIDAIRAELRAKPSEDVQNIVNLIAGGQPFLQAARNFEVIKPDDKFPLAKILTNVLVFAESDKDIQNEEGSPFKLDLGEGFFSPLQNMEQGSPAKDAGPQEVALLENQPISEEPAIKVPPNKGPSASKFKLHQLLPENPTPQECEQDQGHTENP